MVETVERKTTGKGGLMSLCEWVYVKMGNPSNPPSLKESALK